ncbi:MAG: sigma factor [Kofleriaceae bacterium]
MKLMARYCDGDADAFRSMYALVAPLVLGYLSARSRQPEVATALLQDTFLAVHRRRGAYVRGADPVPWIYAIAHRVQEDHLRRSAPVRSGSQQREQQVE